MYTPMSRACAARLVMKSRVGGEPAMAARMVPPCAGHLSIPAAAAPVAVSIESRTIVVISLRTMRSPPGSMPQPTADTGGHDVFLPVAEADGIEGEPALAYPPLVEMNRRHALAELTRDLGGPRCGREHHVHERHAPRRLARNEHRLHAGQTGQRGREAPAPLGPPRLA